MITFLRIRRARRTSWTRGYTTLNEAAATVWRQKAATVASRVDWHSDNHNISASQEYEHCLKMAEHYNTLSGPMVGEFMRMDEI
jgi:hypothetical protein